MNYKEANKLIDNLCDEVLEREKDNPSRYAYLCGVLQVNLALAISDPENFEICYPFSKAEG